MTNFRQLLAERIASGLKRTSITDCAKWAETYRMMSKPFPGLWTFKRHPWLRAMHESSAEFNIGQKAAQMGFTEWALNTAFYNIDVKGIDCLYVLPSDSDASDFSAGRFDPALEASAHLRSLFSDVKNVGHKRAGQCNLYVRGSRSRSKLKSIPTGLIIFDEVDEMLQDNIPLAMERASGQLIRQILMLSTPTIDKIGINKFYRDSTSEHFMFKCPRCSKLIEFVFPDSLVITGENITDPKVKESHYICTQCRGILTHEAKVEYLNTGIFVPEHADRDMRGFSVNQMYSSAAAGSPVNFAISALKAQSNPTDETEFYNSKLGLTHAVEGAKVTDTQVIDVIKNYRMGPSSSNTVRTMGIDVGKVLHVEVDEWILPQSPVRADYSIQCKPRILLATTCDFDELDNLMRTYYIRGAVIDRHPETRLAYQFCCRWWKAAFLCIYAKNMQGKQIQLAEDAERSLLVDRTSWLDLALGRFRTGDIELPFDIPEQYKDHIKEPTRVYERDRDGNPVGRYVSASDDHYAHARNYAEIALLIAASGGDVQNISKFT